MSHAIATPADESVQVVTKFIPVGRLLQHPDNPRGKVELDSDLAELVDSIKENGILQPLLVTPFRAAFHIIAGHRRFVAGKAAGLIRLPCVVRTIDDDTQLDVMMIENIQRQNLTPIQEARGFQKMLQHGRMIRDIAVRLSLSEHYITQRVAILKLGSSVQQMFELNLLPVSAAQVLALTPDHGAQKHYATLALQRQMPVGKLEALIRDTSGQVKKERSGSSQTTRRPVLNNHEMFTRSEAVYELQREGSVALTDIAAAFDDVCDGLCTESDAGREMCEACPAPRLIASMLRRTGIEFKGRGAAN